jgi:hypothetical protein
MDIIEWKRGAHLALTGLSGGDLGAGFTAQVWLSVRGDRGVVLGFGGDGPADDHVRLELVARRGLALRVRRQGVAGALELPAALEPGEWVQVTATLAPDGRAALYLGGAPLAEAQLPAPAWGPARAMLDLDGAAGELRVWGRALTPDEVAATRGSDGAPLACWPMRPDGAVVRDVVGERHATLVGDPRPASATGPELRAAEAPGAVRLDGRGGLQLPPLPPLTSFTIEAWVRPGVGERPTCLLELARGERSLLRAHHDPRTGELHVDGLAALRVPLPAGRWSHLALVVDAPTLRVLRDGRELGQAPLAPPPPGALDRLVVGDRLRGDAGFVGELAELRCWQGCDVPRIVDRRLRRARGDEAGLVACYHLDGVDLGVALDAGPQRLHARARFAAGAPGELLPLRALAGATTVAAQSRLLTDWIPVSAFPPPPRPKPMTPVDDAALLRRALAPYGVVEGDLVRCSVYEVILEPRGGDATAVQVRFDAAVRVVRCEGGATLLEDWPARVTRTVAVPSGGRVRLRVLAGGALDCPALRARVAAMPADVWVVSRPADAHQGALQGLRGDELRAPPPGKPAVLPGASKDAADAAGRLLRQVARAIPAPAVVRPERAILLTPGVAALSWGDVEDAWESTERAFERAGDVVCEFGRDVADLTIRGYEGSKKLIADAARVVATTGGAIAAQWIGSAKEIAVDTAQDGWGVITLVGRTAEGVHRTVVRGVEDAIAAVVAIARRIGAAIADLVALLALLFGWERFLARSDELHDVARRHLARLQGVLPSLAELPAALAAAAAAPARSDLRGKTVGEALGLSGEASLPGVDELCWLVDHMDAAFAGLDLGFDRDRDAGAAAPADVDADASAAAGADAAACVPAGLRADPAGLLAQPIDPLLAAPAQAWAVSGAALTPALRWISRDGAKMLEQAQAQLGARLQVPVLTSLIETVVLRGRKLTLLRLVALLGAIPATLVEGGRGLLAFDAAQKRAPAQEGDDDALGWLQFAVTLVNSVLICCRAGAEAAGARPALRVFFGISSAFGALSAGCDLAVAARATGTARDLAVAHGTFSLAGAVWFGVMAAPLPDGADEVRDGVDLGVEILLGLGELSTSVSSFALQVEGGAQLGRSLGFHFGSWALRGLQKVFDGLDNTKQTAARVGSIVCAGLTLTIDLTDSIWSAIE